MKRGARYSRIDCEVDLEHEITANVDYIKEKLNSINGWYVDTEAKAIKKAMIETILNDL